MALPLEGIRVVEMGQLIAIPHAVKLLADMGAQVVRIESCVRFEGYRTQSFYENIPGERFWDRCANFYEQNRNKMSLTLELTNPQGLETLKELVSVCDVFAENFTPRVMRNFGLQYDDLRRIKPDIIMVSSTGYGFHGPWSDFGAIGYTTEAASGLSHATGYADGPPTIPEIPYADYTAAEHTVFAVMAALVHRARTGRGQFIDLSQTETLTSTVPEVVMDYTVNGRVSERMGNEDASMAPHGCYPCRGEDAWIAIAVTTDAEWSSLCDVLGAGGLLSEPRFADSGSRWANRAALDGLVEGLTVQWDQHELMTALQVQGVPAGAVLSGKQLLMDPHLRARGFYETVEHHPSTEMPPLPYAGRPWKMSATPGGSRSAAPILGEHSRHVLRDLMGLRDASVDDLENEGVVGYEPVNVRPPEPLPLEDQKRQGRIIGYEDDFKETMHREFGG